MAQPSTVMRRSSSRVATRVGHAAVALPVVLAGALAISGCAPASGEPAHAPLAVPYSVQHYTPPPAGAERYEAPRAPPRLSETRTIGAEDDAYTDARVWVARTHGPGVVYVAPATPVVPVGRGYASGAYGYGASGYGAYGRHGVASYGGPPRSWPQPGAFTASPPVSRGGAPAVGGNWAPVPSYGPRFPFPAGAAAPDVTRR